jgi:hypothetical protein
MVSVRGLRKRVTLGGMKTRSFFRRGIVGAADTRVTNLAATRANNARVLRIAQRRLAKTARTRALARQERVWIASARRHFLQERAQQCAPPIPNMAAFELFRLQVRANARVRRERARREESYVAYCQLKRDGVAIVKQETEIDVLLSRGGHTLQQSTELRNGFIRRADAWLRQQDLFVDEECAHREHYHTMAQQEREEVFAWEELAAENPCAYCSEWGVGEEMLVETALLHRVHRHVDEQHGLCTQACVRCPVCDE